MKFQLNQFSKKYELASYDIFLTSSYDDDMMDGCINFSDFTDLENGEIKYNIATINFFIFNNYNLEDILLLADCVSSDLEYVANAYIAYSDDSGGIGSVAIIDEFRLTIDTKDLSEKIQIIKYFLAKTIEKLQIIGTGTLLFMSKALILNLNKSDRVHLINELLDINAIPIYQDENDVVLARNLDYAI
ncbi:hypothetical protein KQI68_01040 [Peptoniphilus sp. MSJ-1]|uniref:Uncharacterized protein n=1 Tax=Peptoniphilus ovalis TaxID=2841503 RepID=A0ABS6FGM0_9FIRM|nr:hypothetical protein [Peptoniphilus ovalis]MBU5668416.1 hypothetical protein [Peptoniphilus ovalis]